MNAPTIGRSPRRNYYHLYVILDIYSRYVVGWMLAHHESADLASRLIRETVEKQGVGEDDLTIHSDRGPSMASLGVAQLLATLAESKRLAREIERTTGQPVRLSRQELQWLAKSAKGINLATLRKQSALHPDDIELLIELIQSDDNC